jgi:formylglycine-generating enzyme required for sulfatase activity
VRVNPQGVDKMWYEFLQRKNTKEVVKMKKILRESMLRKFLFFVPLILIIFFGLCVTSKEYYARADKSSEIIGDDGAPMVLVPADEFIMGPSGAEKTVHLKAFYIDKNEVTVSQFKKFVTATGYVTTAERLGYTFDFKGKYYGFSWKNPNYKSYSDKHPVTCVSPEDAEAYAKWAGKRLPTEAEWEKAARGTDGRKYPWGNEIPTFRKVGNFGGEKGPEAVGSYPKGASPYGCLDMIGNLWEWSYSEEQQGDKKYAYRGGSFEVGGEMITVYYKHRRLGYVSPNYTSKHCVTFRCVKSD